jgi:site-specific DNA-cytosine methylase
LPLRSPPSRSGWRHVAIRRPELYVVENVPGMKKFPVVMEAMTKLPDYYVHVACPIKSSLWLPQKRDRLIIIGSVPGAVATGLPLWRSRPSRGLKPGRYRFRY